MRCFKCTIRECLLDSPIRKLFDPGSIWDYNVFSPVWIFNGSYPALLYSLNSAIWKYGLFLFIRENTLECPIRETGRITIIEAT